MLPTVAGAKKMTIPAAVAHLASATYSKLPRIHSTHRAFLNRPGSGGTRVKSFTHAGNVPNFHTTHDHKVTPFNVTYVRTKYEFFMNRGSNHHKLEGRGQSVSENALENWAADHYFPVGPQYRTSYGLALRFPGLRKPIASPTVRQPISPIRGCVRVARIR